jgi:hypothetical protein
MYAHNVPIRLARTLAPHRFAAGALVALALLTAACSNDSASRITAPSLSASMDKSSSAAASGPSLGSASGFAALAGGPAVGAVTCTRSTVTGDVGVVSPGTFTNTGCTINNGTVNTDATAAYGDFLTAYAALAPKPGDVCTTETGTLANVTLPPGVYCFNAAAALTGTLTLKGPSNGVWVFLIGTTGTGALTGTNFSVVMSGGGQACNVTWWVAQGATMTTSNFIGTILAGADITVTGGTFNGDALAGGAGSTSEPTGAVTLKDTNLTGCPGGRRHGNGKEKCNQGVGNGSEGCDPGDSNHHNSSNDEDGGTPGHPGRSGGNN